VSAAISTPAAGPRSCLGPGHSKDDRSLSLRLTPTGRILFFPHSARDSLADCFKHLGIEKGEGELVDKAEWARQRRAHEEEQRKQRASDQALCASIWRDTVALEGSLAESYLWSRNLILEDCADVRFHPAAPRAKPRRADDPRPLPEPWPAMVAVVRDRDGASQALHLTYVARDGRGKAFADRSRLMFGPMRGGTVHLTPPGSALALGEGIETCLAYRARTGLPVWAALTTSQYASFALPRGVRRLVIAADGDKGGMAAATALAERACRSCDVEIDPAPGRARIGRTFTWRPPVSEPAGPRLAFSRTSKFSFEDYDDLSPSTKPWLVKNAWPMKGVVWIVGASGAAKTFFTIDGTAKIAGGAEKVWGRRAQQRGVVYVAAEDPDGCRARIKAFRATKGSRAAEEGRRLPFKLVPQAVNLLDPGDVEDFIVSSRGIADDMLLQFGVELGLVCFDTFSCCIPGGDENNGADMSRALEGLYSISRDLDCLVVVVAHFGKSGTTGGIRGWSGLGYNADGIVTIERDEDDAELRHVAFQKVKNGPGGGRMDFTLKEVDLGLADDSGDAMTSCIVNFQPHVSALRSKRKAGPEDRPGPKLVMRAIGQLLDVGQTYVVPPVPGVPPGTTGVDRIKLRERAYSIGHGDEEEKAETRKRNFNRDVQALLAAGVLREYEGVVWKIR
jgi:putative DNA primase/helicase